MSTDSRNNSRVKTNIDCIFGGTPEAKRNGKVTSLSVAGCFVKTTMWTTDFPKMYIRLWHSSQRWLRLQGIVLYHLEQIGFGLRFVDLTPQDESAIREMIEQSANTESSFKDKNEQPA
jgi:hypothetical protein